MDNYLINFLSTNWLTLSLLLLMLVKVVPAKYVKADMLLKAEGRDAEGEKLTILHAVFDALSGSLIMSCFNALAFIGLKQTGTLLIFIVVASEVLFKKEISTQAVSLVVIGIIALYLDELVQNGKSLNFFGFKWERRDDR